MIGQLIGALAGQLLPQKIMMSATAKALTSTALSGLGTMYDNQQAEKKAKRKQANFYVDLRNAAQRAGFNPLTVLRSGTAGAYADAGYAPALTSNAFTNMFNDMRETDARISNMKAQERNMAHGQRMDKLNYELRKAEYQFNQGLASEALKANLDVVPARVEVATKNWRQLTNNMKSGIRNAENIKAQSKIEAMADTQATVKFMGIDWQGSGAMSSGEAFEQSMGNNVFLDIPIGIAMIGDMVGSKLKDWTHGRKAADAKMRRIYRNIHADQIIRALETNQNAATRAMKVQIQPPLASNHLMQLPRH
jgi:hypothetical protein